MSMKSMNWFRSATLVAFAVAAGVTCAETLDAQQPTLQREDYGQFERLGAFELDPTGRWVIVSITRVDGSRELRLHESDGRGEALVLEHGSDPHFSGDGAWLAYRKGVSEDEREAAETAIQDRLGLVDLSAATDTVLFDIATFAFRDDGAWLAARGVAASDSVGGDLIVMEPGSGAQTVIGNVDEFAWQDEGGLLAATLKTAWGSANGVVVFDPDASTLRTVESGDADYTGLTWHEASARLAVLRSVETEGREEPTHDVIVWNDVNAPSPEVLLGTAHPDLPDDVRITDFDGIRFSEDGHIVFVGVRAWEPASDESGDSEDGDGDMDGDENEGDDDGGDGEGEANAGGDRETDDAEDVAPADVQIWHSGDDRIVRAQEYRATQLAQRTLTAAWNLDTDRLVVLGEDLEEGVTIVAGGRWALAPDYDPYRFERRFGASTADWYRVDVSSGARVRLATAVEFGVRSHPDLDRVLVYENDRWLSVRLADLERVEIGDGRSFTQPLDQYDYPGPRPPWGIGGWSEDGERALLYDEHDVWAADLRDGSLRRMTEGGSAQLQYRVANVDPDRPRFGAGLHADDDEVWFSVRNPRTKESGFARGTWNGEGVVRLLEPARVSALTKARDADRFALRRERWDDAPDVFTGGENLDDLVQVTEINPFQGDYAWGHAELLDYTTDAGHDLQAILVYPADFQEGQKYPLILYQYERLSDNLHVYDLPSERDYYNYQAWSQEGYFVLMPDIVYEPGRPGPSALDAVEHALDAAVATGHVDPDAMGLIGHSWGGYQAAYLPTRTNRFAASVAGAAITNFMSFMGAVHWNGGLPEVGHWETGQARMAVPYWEDLEGHLESSPANFIMDLETPMMLMHGDADGVVDFRQGLEFYNYARRAGKEMVLLVYPGADHGLREETQQVDYHRRILAWFDHYLRGAPAEPWITDGETWTERAKRLGR
jgi:dipeptidyl aminopeptidase/acylaminoacyl peptidase